MNDPVPGALASGSSRGHQDGRVLLLAALLSCTFLTALDVLVVATAMPTIVAQLGGMMQYAWVFSTFLLASTVTVPLYGKLADVYGRKPVFTFGTIVFLLGSALCGAAQDMNQLILFRTIQGLGAGAVFPVTLTIVGDVFSLEERARVVGLFSATWGVAGISGPLIGGFLTDHLSWRWIFFLNLPVGVVALSMLWLTLRERVQRRQHRIDYGGATILTAALTALMVGMLAAGESAPVLSLQAAALLVGGVAMLVAFGWYERRVPEPILPLDLFRKRLFVVAAACVFTAGMINSGVGTFAPVFAQGVLGGTATLAGAVLMPTAITWTTGSVLSGRLLMRLSYRPTTVVGTLFITGGSVVFASLSQASPIWLILAGVGIIGFGMGLSTAMMTVAVQSSVPWEQRGVATSSNQFFRSIGQAIGVTVFAAVFNQRMSDHLAATGQDLAIANQVLDPIRRATIDPALLESIRGSLDSSVHAVFVLMAVVAALGVLAASRLPAARAQDLAWNPDGGAGGRPADRRGAPGHAQAPARAER